MPYRSCERKARKEIRQRYDIWKNIRAEQVSRQLPLFPAVLKRVSHSRQQKFPLALWRLVSKRRRPSIDKTIAAIVSGNLRQFHPGIAATGHQLVQKDDGKMDERLEHEVNRILAGWEVKF